MDKERNEKQAEKLSADALKLRQMLKSLSHIKAPEDFNFRLKARIASAQSARTPNFLKYFRRFALPMFLSVTLLAFFSFYINFHSFNQNTQIAEISEPLNFPVTENKPDITENTPSLVSLSVTGSNKSNQESSVTPKNPHSKTKVTKSKNNTPEKEKFSGGSKDFAIKEEVPVNPKFNATVIPQSQKNPERNTFISIQNILSELGLEVAVENDKLVVKSVKSKSLAESSGIQEADLVEAIDDQPIRPEIIFRKRVEGKTITVLRNGTRLKIALKNK
jgi:hypothetical protein